MFSWIAVNLGTIIMNKTAMIGLLIPFAGTALGSACVFFMRKQLGDKVRLIMAMQKSKFGRQIMSDL